MHLLRMAERLLKAAEPNQDLDEEKASAWLEYRDKWLKEYEEEVLWLQEFKELHDSVNKTFKSGS